MGNITEALRKLDTEARPHVSGIRIVYSTEWTRAVSERDQRGDADARAREAAQSVAVAQPHRARAVDPSDPLLGSALGRYCLLRWPGEARKRLRVDRFSAGTRFAEKIDADRVARGFKPRLYGEGEYTGALTDEQLQARRELCAMQRADAETVVRAVHDRAVGVMSRLCWEDKDCGPYDEDIVFHALYKLALHFGIEERPYHERA